MKKTFKIGIASLVILIFQSFVREQNSQIFGTYGVANDDLSGIQLVISKNHTYTFKDFSNPKKVINTSGFWEIKKEFILLKSTEQNPKFHNRWKIIDNGSKAKSRKGMTYYTLCKIKSSL